MQVTAAVLIIYGTLKLTDQVNEATLARVDLALRSTQLECQISASQMPRFSFETYLLGNIYPTNVL